MSPDSAFLASAVVAALALKLAADYGPAALRPWARGCVLWSGMLWAGVAVTSFVGFAIGEGRFDADAPLRYLGGMTWVALLLGSGFFAAGYATARILGKTPLPRWARHGAALLSAAPGVLLGYVAYRLLMLTFFSEAPFWRQTDRIAGVFDTLTIWLIANAALGVGLVRMLYDVRMDVLADRQARLESEATAARLAALEARLRPHALLNALGGLAGLIRTDAAAAEAMTLALARLLRRTLATSDAPTVALADELALARDYLAVERHRLGDRLAVTVDAADDTLGLAVTVDAADDTLGLAVPRLALLPLVENAVVHGAGRTAAPVAVAVRARRVGDRLVVTVEDDGPPFADGWTGGTGLTSVGERLRLLYGDAAALRVTTGAVEGAPKRVVLDLPAVAAPPASAPSPAAPSPADSQ